MRSRRGKGDPSRGRRKFSFPTSHRTARLKLPRPFDQFYGGWVTCNLEGKMKGGEGTLGW